MNILFVIDRVELKYFEFNNLVTNFWLIKEFLERNNEVFITTIDKLSLNDGIAYASGYYSFLKEGNIFLDKTKYYKQKIEDFRLVMFRPDPPVDLDYINATYVFDFVDRNKTFVVNDTKSIRDFNEKMHAVLFKEFMPKNLVSSSRQEIIEFLKENKEIILKPLNKCFGAGVMYLKEGDKNTSVIINSVTNNETNLVMVQKYLPEAIYGDKRVLMAGGEVFDYCVRKLPSNNDFKFNEHNDKCVVKEVLTAQEKENFTPIAQKLNSMGIYTAGLDVVSGKILEVNVTSPCYFIKEINNAFGINFEKILTDKIFDKICALCS